MFSKFFKKDKKSLFKKLNVTVDKNMRDYSKEEFFVKKAEEAKALLDRVGFPKEFDAK